MRLWLKELRKQKKLRQGDIAKVLGVTRQQYNFIENGKRQVDMNLPTVSKIADFFDIPLSKIRQHEEELATRKENSA